MDRHGRQVRLAEIGAEGQRRIANASVDVGLDGLAADVAVRYLAGAGVSRIRVKDGSLVGIAAAVDPAIEATLDEGLGAEPAPDLPLRDPVARDLARGAHLALGAILGALRGSREAS
jgi:hypothetical protein